MNFCWFVTGFVFALLICGLCQTAHHPKDDATAPHQDGPRCIRD